MKHALVGLFFLASISSWANPHFCVGDNVMDGHTQYHITSVYADGTADIVDTFGNYKNVNTSDLTLPITNVNGFSIGEKVMLEHTSYTVMATYTDGTVDIEDTYGNYKNESTNNLTMPVTNVNGFSIGEKVMMGHTQSTVMAAYVDGTVDIQDAYGNYSNVSTNQLSLPEQCTGGCH